MLGAGLVERIRRQADGAAQVSAVVKGVAGKAEGLTRRRMAAGRRGVGVRPERPRKLA